MVILVMFVCSTHIFFNVVCNLRMHVLIALYSFLLDYDPSNVNYSSLCDCNPHNEFT